jgi:SAM-dependent methyltransferase
MRNILSPTKFIYNFIESELKKYQHLAKGDFVDIGCGQKPFFKIFKNITSYIGVDSNKKSAADIVCDALNLKIKSSSVDSVLCTQVLEHVQDPNKLISEISRISKPGAVCILTAPHISRVHGSPKDYFRFTPFGLKILFQKNNFKVIKIDNTGGFFLTIVYLTSFYLKEKIKYFSIPFNSLMFLMYLVIMPIDKNKNYAFNYIIIAKKREVKNG